MIGLVLLCKLAEASPAIKLMPVGVCCSQHLLMVMFCLTAGQIQFLTDNGKLSGL